MSAKKKVIIFASFFNNSKHVGTYRIKRVIKWLNNHSFDVYVVSLGSSSFKMTHEWGTNIVIHSYTINFLENLLKTGLKFYPIKVIYIIFKFLLKILFVPDEEMLWVNKVCKNEEIVKVSSDVDFLFASSPLESGHVASYKMSKKVFKPYIVDMRDGWLDESLKPDYFSKIFFRKKYETWLENKILTEAKVIFVSSENWKNLLVKRKPILEDKVKVITNAYPNNYSNLNFQKKISNNSNLKLFYIGRLTGSRKTQKAEYLLEPFEKYKFASNSNVEVNVFGNLRRIDISDLIQIKKQSIGKHYSILIKGFVPRELLLPKINESNGLLLLSVSNNAIPVKFYEYLICKRPVLTITFNDSALWNVCLALPQFFLYELNGNIDYNKNITDAFLSACKTGNVEYFVPEKYSEEFIGNIFCNALDKMSLTL